MFIVSLVWDERKTKLLGFEPYNFLNTQQLMPPPQALEIALWPWQIKA